MASIRNTPYLPQDHGRDTKPLAHGLDLVQNDSDSRTKVYTSRWLALFLFCLIGLLPQIIWNTWGPISTSAQLALGWTKVSLVMLPMLGVFALIVTMVPLTYIMQKYGLRIAALAASLLMVLSTGIRCMAPDPMILLWLANIAAILNGMAATVSVGGAAQFSVVWFPVSERATATAVACMSQALGLTFSFIIGPLIVDQYQFQYGNETVHEGSSSYMHKNSSHASHTTRHQVQCLAWEAVRSIASVVSVLLSASMGYLDDARGSIGGKTIWSGPTCCMKYILFPLWIIHKELGMAVMVLALIVAFFRDKPPSPPSISAGADRIEFKKGLLNIIRLPAFWLVCFAHSIPHSIYGAWVAVWNFNLEPLGVTEIESGWIGFYSTICFAVIGLVVSRFSDAFFVHTKTMLVGFYLLALAGALWLCLIFCQCIPWNTVCLYAAMILTAVSVNGAAPLFDVLACEVSYPINESVTCGFLASVCSCGRVFLFTLLAVPNIGHDWIPWCLLGGVAAGIMLLLILRVGYYRHKLDSAENKTGSTNQHTNSPFVIFQTDG